ncbi:MAG TPA: translation factor GTPase family protein [Streptosporangiaceae bacterium]|nr:translation factor GTPase family protein [Streptosporangiaceae bacterium]
MHTLNLGILAHVDAGKTSLTERLLYAAGVIDEIGSVDEGSTQTDTLALERQRGITIKSAVASFAIGSTNVNLIDTPGHPDFIAEVERVLSVLDGAVLVISAVEGVQAQTQVLMRALRRLRIPTLIFVNKIDRRGADPERVLRAIAERLTPAAIPAARPSPELLADHDDALLAEYLTRGTLSRRRGREGLATLSRAARVHPVFFGSAITGAGVPELTEAIPRLLPVAADDTQAPPSAAAFKVERGPAGEKIAYVRMFGGTLRIRDQTRAGKVTAISVFRDGAAVRGDAVRAGDIAKLWGLHTIRIGDAIGAAHTRSGPSFSPPTLETVVSARDKVRLHNALSQLAEQDPLINLRQDDGEIRLSLYGEVQKEVIEATLHADFGLAVTFSNSQTICIERPSGTGHAVEYIKGGDNPFLAAVGLRVEPGPPGVDFRLEIELGALPLAFLKAIEDTVRATLSQGIRGWQVTDCVVTLTHSGYYPRQSHAHARFDKSMSSTGADFRGLTPLVLMSALRQAGTRVCQPVQRFHLDIPADAASVVLPLLAKLDAIPSAQRITGARCAIEGVIPAACTHELAQRLPGLTSGEGVLESVFSHYEQVRGSAPARARTDRNPLDRREYLLHVTRGVLTQNDLCVTSSATEATRGHD